MEDILTPAEAAESLRISVSTLYDWIATKKIRSIRLPTGRLRIPASEIDSILQVDETEIPSPRSRKSSRDAMEYLKSIGVLK